MKVEKSDNQMPQFTSEQLQLLEDAESDQRNTFHKSRQEACWFAVRRVLVILDV